jgi:hypothetical protein
LDALQSVTCQARQPEAWAVHSRTLFETHSAVPAVGQESEQHVVAS